MKKTNSKIKIALVILMVAIIGVTLVKISESTFGVVNVCVSAVLIVGLYGIIYVPIMQIRNYKDTQNFRAFLLKEHGLVYRNGEYINKKN